MDVTEILLTALQVLSPLLLGGITWLAARAADLIRSKIDREHLRGALVRLDDAVVPAVKELEQTAGDEAAEPGLPDFNPRG